MNIYDLSYDQIRNKVKQLGEPKFRADQLWQGLYHQLISSPDDITTFSKNLRIKIANEFSFSNLHNQKEIKSRDNQTIKTLFRLNDGYAIESFNLNKVFIQVE